MQFKTNYSFKSTLIAKNKEKQALLRKNASSLLRGKISKEANHKQSFMLHHKVDASK